ncbi:MAG TPA: L-fucose:H+ symporter permease [Acidisarcina sp.]
MPVPLPPTSAVEPVGTRDEPLFPPGNRLPFTLVTALFFLWGIPNNLNDVLIRQFMKSFTLNRLEGGLVQFAFYMGYFCLAIPAALLMRKLGYKAGFIIGLLLFAAGTFLFWPAALAGKYAFFLVALFVIASGLAFLETASNPFIAQAGPAASSERRLNFSQAFNPIGSITGVLAGTVFIFSGIELNAGQVTAMKAQHVYQAYLQTETLRVVRPYLVLGAIALFWAILIARTKFPHVRGEEEAAGGAHGVENHGKFRDLLQYPHFLLAVAAQFMYVGAQVGTWSYFIQYVQQYTHEPEKTAGYFLTGTLVAFCAGRFAASALMKTFAPNKLMGTYAVANIVLVTVGILAPGWLGLWSILLTSFFMSMMFPTIFALGLRGLGANTKIGGSLIVMAIVGGALLPLVMGHIIDITRSAAMGYLVPLAGYICVALYGFLWARRVPQTNASFSHLESGGTVI